MSKVGRCVDCGAKTIHPKYKRCLPCSTSVFYRYGTGSREDVVVNTKQRIVEYGLMPMCLKCGMKGVCAMPNLPTLSVVYCPANPNTQMEQSYTKHEQEET